LIELDDRDRLVQRLEQLLDLGAEGTSGLAEYSDLVVFDQVVDE
jgi:hypothetical protein